MCSMLFILLEHFVSSRETQCFAIRNTMFLPKKLLLQKSSELIYDIYFIRYDIYFHYLTFCFSINYHYYDVMTLIFIIFAHKFLN